MIKTKQLFTSEHVCMTASVNIKALDCTGYRLWINECVYRHFSCDYGDISEEDKHTNNESLLDQGMIMSVYKNSSDIIWIITDQGHEVTTILLPSEY